jgi:hypothetical protein
MDVIVPERGTVTLDADAPEAALQGAVVKRTLTRLADFAELGLVEEAQLSRMLSAARDATSDALASLTPPVRFVPGTRRPDLRRFTGFTSRLTDLSPGDTQLVWNTLRAVEPTRLERLTLTDVLAVNLHRVIGAFRFQDVTVKAGGQLTVKPSTKLLWAKDIVIEAGGRIVVQGASLAIRAHSVRGL